MPKFVVKDMETLHIDEMRAQINLLYANLESVPVSLSNRSGGGQLKKNNKSR
jgi:hypothetical protein